MVLPRLDEQHHLLEEAGHPLGLGQLARDGDLVAPHVDRHREGALDEAQQLVPLPQQAHHEMVAGHEHLDLGLLIGVKPGSTLPARIAPLRGPAERSAAEDVEVEMVHQLAGVFPDVGDDAVAALGDALLGRHRPDGVEQVAEQDGRRTSRRPPRCRGALWARRARGRARPG